LKHGVPPEFFSSGGILVLQLNQNQKNQYLNNMNLPEDIKSMLMEIGKEVELQVSAAPVTVTEPEQAATLEVDVEFLQRAIINSQERAEREYMDHPDYFPHALVRTKPDVLLGEKVTRKRVCAIEDLLKLASRLVKMEVTNYWGASHEDLLVVKAQIPDLYEARVGYIRVKHVPDKFLKDIKFVDRKPPGKKGKGEIALILNELEPVWTREGLQEIDRKEIVKNYNFVTFKIHKESHTLVSWLPGQDTRSGLCESLEEEWVGLEKKSEMALRILRNE
jgi:hypothetical protein